MGGMVSLLSRLCVFIVVLCEHCRFHSQVIINSTITPNMTFTKTSQKFGQWADSRANTVFGLGFSSEQQLAKELENLRKQAEIIPQLMEECESMTQKLQTAELKNQEMGERMQMLQADIGESELKQSMLKSELKKFMDVLDGKIDELHEFRQGLSKLGVDN
ncbi:UNVERIFIED_CONTAM: hypothetical protein FKN15_016926 [Acipenser sinensis]